MKKLVEDMRYIVRLYDMGFVTLGEAVKLAFAVVYLAVMGGDK